MRGEKEVEFDRADADRLGDDGAPAIGLHENERAREAPLPAARRCQRIYPAPREFRDGPVAVDVVPHDREDGG